MITFDDVHAWREHRRREVCSGLTLGFVPTMGALHEGHLSLVRRSRAENDRTLVSIFVNPTQFDQDADLATYPRTVDSDLDHLRASGVDCVLLPSAGQMYPDGYKYRVVETERSRTLEGASRPGHFDGVLTVVLRLLVLAAAERAYFGEKDWQQLVLVRGLAGAFLLPTEIVPCATVREEGGLARSSRNARLSASDRRRASTLYRVLTSAPTADDAKRTLEADGLSVDYVEEWDGRRLGAVRIGDVRLIDNVPVRSGR